MSSIPTLHQSYLDTLVAQISSNPLILALLGAGSLIHGGFDEHSDLDFVLIVDENAYEEVMATRMAIAAQVGPLISAFTGEHVGEPRLLICLYGPPLLHVDLKFVTSADLDRAIENRVLLWAREPEAIAQKLAKAEVAWPNQSPQWFEDRVWTWLHYGATKLQRGELFKAIGMVGWFREQVLGPMLMRRAGLPQRGVRRIEAIGEAALLPTLADHNIASVKAALKASLALYVNLARDDPPPKPAPSMPAALQDFLNR
jgi:hypothetical protein